MGAISADHKYQGRLIDSSMFWASSQPESRKIGRRAAVVVLNGMKAEKEHA